MIRSRPAYRRDQYMYGRAWRMCWTFHAAVDRMVTDRRFASLTALLDLDERRIVETLREYQGASALLAARRIALARHAKHLRKTARQEPGL